MKAEKAAPQQRNGLRNCSRPLAADEFSTAKPRSTQENRARFLERRFGLDPLRARVVAGLAFGEASA